MPKPVSTLHQFIRYGVVGGVAAVCDTALLYLLYREFRVNHFTAAAAGFTLGLLVNYLISIAWVFETRGNFAQEFVVFSVIGLGGLALTELILWLCIDHAGITVLPAKALALFLVLIWNFTMRKRFVFREKFA